jgi:hypothetical protein
VLLLTWADDIVRARPTVLWTVSAGRKYLSLVCVLCVFGMLYGGVMGSYAWLFGQRWLQVVYSAVKVPILLMVTSGLSLPFFFVVNSLYGLRDDFGKVLRALLATQAGVTVILASLSPLTIVWYLSCENYRAAILFNALMFAVASVSAQLVLRQFYRPLIEKNPMHQRLLKLWITLYGFVGIQMGWTLRPFIGSPNAPTQFFRDQAWGNAYLELYKIITGLFG